MFDPDNLVYSSSAIALIALAAFGLYEVSHILRHRLRLERKHFVLLSLDPKTLGCSIEDFVKKVKIPFVFEIVVHHLGSAVNYYISVPSRRVKMYKNLPGVTLEKEEYNIFHPQGENIGLYLQGGGTWPGFEFSKFDLSRVNEIGEGVAIQYVFGRRMGKKIEANFRAMVSAPSSQQAREIVESIEKSLPGFRGIEAHEENFIHKLNFREFDRAERGIWQMPA